MAADLLESVLGQSALVQAGHIGSITPARPGSLAPLCKVHREVLAEVRKRTPLADGPLMEIRERVRAKRADLGPA